MVTCRNISVSIMLGIICAVLLCDTVQCSYLQFITLLAEPLDPSRQSKQKGFRSMLRDLVSVDYQTLEAGLCQVPETRHSLLQECGRTTHILLMSEACRPAEKPD